MTYHQFVVDHAIERDRVLSIKKDALKIEALKDRVDQLEKQIKHLLWYPAFMAEELGFYSGRDCLVYGDLEDPICRCPEWFDARWEKGDQAFFTNFSDIKIINPQYVMWVTEPEEVIS